MAANNENGFAILKLMGYSHPGWKLCRRCKHWSRTFESQGKCDAPASVGMPPVNTEDCGNCHAFEAKKDDE